MDMHYSEVAVKAALQLTLLDNEYAFFSTH